MVNPNDNVPKDVAGTDTIEGMASMLGNRREAELPQNQNHFKESASLADALSTLSLPTEVKELPFPDVGLPKYLDISGGTMGQYPEIAEKLVKDATLLCGIPDDLLAYVFDFVVEVSERKDRSPLVLSQVSHRFRYIALGTSSLWSSIRAASNSGTLTTTRNTTYLERSGMSPLNVTFILHSKKNVYAKLFRFMKYVLPHTMRWREFNLELDGGKLGVVRFFNSLGKMGPIHLPKLERLRIFTNFYLNSPFDMGRFRPFLHWTAPALRTLELRDFVVDMRQFSSLTDISVSIHSAGFPFVWFFNGLASLQSLCSLHIGLHCMYSMMNSEGVTLPSVSHLSFVILVTGNAHHVHILSLLSCPNMVDLTITLSVGSDWLAVSLTNTHTTTESAIRHYFAHLFARSAERYQQLSHLRLKVTASRTHGVPGYDAFGYAVSEIPLASLPNLEHLTLDGSLPSPHITLTLRDFMKSHFGVLKTITIQSPEPYELSEWLAQVFATLIYQKVWEHFEQLVIRKEGEGGTAIECTTIPREETSQWVRDSISSELLPST